MSDAPLQSSLFEEDYLLRELGQVAHVPQKEIIMGGYELSVNPVCDKMYFRNNLMPDVRSPSAFLDATIGE